MCRRRRRDGLFLGLWGIEQSADVVEGYLGKGDVFGRGGAVGPAGWRTGVCFYILVRMDFQTA